MLARKKKHHVITMFAEKGRLHESCFLGEKKRGGGGARPTPLMLVRPYIIELTLFFFFIKPQEDARLQSDDRYEDRDPHPHDPCDRRCYSNATEIRGPKSNDRSMRTAALTPTILVAVHIWQLEYLSDYALFLPCPIL